MGTKKGRGQKKEVDKKRTWTNKAVDKKGCGLKKDVDKKGRGQKKAWTKKRHGKTSNTCPYWLTNQSSPVSNLKPCISAAVL